MKGMQFTTRELEVLVWALNSRAHEIVRERSRAGKPAMNEQAKILSDMCARAYQLMCQAHKEEV